MSSYFSSFGTKIPRMGKGYDDVFTVTKTKHAVKQPVSCSNYKVPNNLSKQHIGFVSKFPVMEEEQQKRLDVLPELSEDYSKELEVAVRAVQMACSLCQRVQDSIISDTGSVTNHRQVQSKDDNSPVTVADWSVQAIVSWMLSECLGSQNVSIVAEEDVQSLSKANSSELLEAVVETVNQCLAEAPRFGVQEPKCALSTSDVLEIIGRCSSTGGPTGRFWVLDPVDGTLGFVRGDQYAVALALIEDGEVKLGVLGCPNYPMRKEWLSYHHRYHRIISKLTPPTAETWNKGCVLYAKRGSGKAWMQPLIHVNKMFVWPNHAKQVSVSPIDNPALATFCEPVEKANSSHSFTAGLAHTIGLRKQPLRVYSMVKYAAIARGDAEVFMKFARAGYKEKIWDHAAGVIIIQEAGGMVTDAGGLPLDFSKGLYLEGLDRGIVACSGATLHAKIIDAVDASWGSSGL
ncbi:PAP-specific phosphatase HAL2-like 3'(2'),5'-bisphosphate nucleotidase [Vigna angularis]|uniref:3'(2'),5'-bisphosphate nucleotidase n=2 Tax=Phaseolus angularis TaxID=3914 RepID=A0A8T0KD42_PHAAN|nr:PAP-specific phosphatase HAL2-like isoform X1 [Vigna angularis]KAG2396115.1 PAP-specific phosphatase HAL2-like 3'(2'),5'-bisphosphate nucleotidase [Vigna angularis]